MAQGNQQNEDGGKKMVAVNRKARFEYEILEIFEAGIVLTGSEIKSIRQGGLSLAESYVRPQGTEILLLNAHIREYAFSKHEEINPERPRKLLLHASEIGKLRTRVEQKGLTIVPLGAYLKRGRAKIEIAIARGKAAPDKRDSIKERDAKRDLARFIKG